MSKLAGLKRQLEIKSNERAALLQAAKDEAVEKKMDHTYAPFSTEDQKKWDSLTADIQSLEETIKREEKLAEIEKNSKSFIHITSDSREPETEEKLYNQFSWTKFVANGIQGKQVGAEGEVSQIGEAEARKSGLGLNGQGTLPRSFFDLKKAARQKQANRMRKDFSLGTSGEGGEMVPTLVGEVVPALAPNPFIIEAGAQVLNLSKPIKIPRKTSLMTAAVRGEKVAATETTAALDTIDLDPISVSAWVEYTKEIFFFADTDVDQMIQMDLTGAWERKISYEAIVGENFPGVMSNVNVPVIAIGANGGALTKPLVDQLPEATELNNAPMNGVRYVTNPKVKRAAKGIAIDAGSGRFLVDHGSSDMGEYPMTITNHVPSNLEKGSSGTVLSALIFGNWTEFYLALFGGLDFVFNQYTKSKQAMVEVIMHSWLDMDLRHDKSFSLIKDITT